MNLTTTQSVGLRAQRAVTMLALLLLGIAYAPTLSELAWHWTEYPEYSHGLLMPPVAAWLLWSRRKELREVPRRASALGTLLLVASLGILLLGEMKLSWFLKPYSLVSALAGLIWALYGWRVLRLCMPALLVLLLMCPLPGRVQRDITLPLKNTAALLATGLLDLSGIHATLEGNLIHLPGIDSLWVADACSGIRSLISLVSIAILGCIFWQRSLTLKLVIVVSSVPIAVFVNGLRIWLTGFLSVHASPDAAQGFFHFFEGFVMFGAGALLLLGWARLLGWVLTAWRTP